MTRKLSRQAFVRGAVGACALLGSCRPSAPAMHTSVDYAGAKNLFNTRFNKSTPAAVVAVKSTDDVQKAVAFAANNGVKIAARSGGHSYVGASSADGAMVIDLRQLPAGTTYDDGPGQATVSAAADPDSVQTALTVKGRSIPSGSCPTVGVAGLTLGGGWVPMPGVRV